MKILALSVLLVASSGFATTFGPSTGGGGFALNCPATLIEPARVQLLDLYEGSSVNNFGMASASGDVVQDYFEAVKRVYTLQGYPSLADQRRDAIVENVKNFFRRVNAVDSADQLPKASDLGELPWIPANCTLEQVAFYNDATGGIVILKPLFEKMDSASQAALVEHELYYHDYRDLGDKTSVFARRATAHSFAIRGIVPVLDGVTSQSREFWVVPENPDPEAPNTLSSFMLTPEDNGQLWSLQFSQLAGRPQLTKTWAEFPAYPWQFKFGRSKANPQFVGCILTTPNQDIRNMVVPIHGTMLSGLSLRYTFKTDEPIRIDMLNLAGEVQASGLVDGGSACNGRKPVL